MPGIADLLQGMNPQLLQSLGLPPGTNFNFPGQGGGGGSPFQQALPALAAKMAGGAASGMPFNQLGTGTMTAPGEGPPPNPPAGAGGGIPPGVGNLMGAGSPPGAMPNPGGFSAAPAGGASDQPKAPNNQEPTGENPSQRPPMNALPHFPRNRFGAMLLPPGGQVGAGNQGTNPTGAFDWNKLLSQFLQKRGISGQPGMVGPTSGMGGGTMGGAPSSGPMPY